MDDTISRTAAIDAIMEILDRPNHAEFLYTDEICEALQNLPSAWPEIVRCKDCKHYRPNLTCVEGHYNGCAMWLDNGNEIMVAPDDYCSYAERREEEE